MISSKSLRQNTPSEAHRTKAQRKLQSPKPTPEIVKLRAGYFLLGSPKRCYRRIDKPIGCAIGHLLAASFGDFN